MGLPQPESPGCPHPRPHPPPGSSTQIGVLVIPFCVLFAWAMGQPLDLNFNEFEATVLFISVLLAVVVVQDGSGNYLKGLMLVLTYAFVSAGLRGLARRAWGGAGPGAGRGRVGEGTGAARAAAPRGRRLEGGTRCRPVGS
jgi:hypothetical protein